MSSYENPRVKGRIYMHKIRIACVGTGQKLPRLIAALVDKKIVPPENIFLSRGDGPDVERFEASGCRLLSDDINAVMKGELIVISAPGNELAAVLAPFCGCTNGRYIIALSRKATLDYVSERLAKGTHIMAVCTNTDEETSEITGEIAYTRGFAEYMKPVCRDVVRALCVSLTEDGQPV